MPYTKPRRSTATLDILEMEIETPTEAKKNGFSMRIIALW